jgi:hypothetical protein
MRATPLQAPVAPTRLLVKYREEGGVFKRGAAMGVRPVRPELAGKGGFEVVEVVDGSTPQQKLAQLEQDSGEHAWVI